jgi:coenzyme PQQ biosynthesis protein PqqD
MTQPEGRPQLRPGCRLAASGNVLLIPEGTLRLEGPASCIVQACDGTKTVLEIVASLFEQFPGADQARISEETSTFLRKLFERAIIEFV